MSLNNLLKDHMDAGRHLFGVTSKLSIADLTVLMDAPTRSRVLEDSTTQKIKPESIGVIEKGDFNTLHSDGSGDGRRVLISTAFGSTISNEMFLYLVMRKSKNAQNNSITLRIGGFDNLTNLNVSSDNWEMYTIPLKKSASQSISIYCNETGDLVDIKYFALIQTGDER